MELCTARPISNLPHSIFLSPNHAHLRWKTALPLKHASIYRTKLGLQYYANSSLKSTASEETSTVTSQYVKEEADRGIKMEDVSSTETDGYGGNEGAKEESPSEDQMQPYEFLDKLNVQLDSENSYSILLLGGGSLVALWFATAIVGAIESIPVFPKLMEVVGLAYTLWFSTRYLIFKKNREELAAKIEGLKQQVLGSNDD